MAKSFIAVEHSDEQVAQVTIGPAGGGAGQEAWFRLFRALVLSGTWASLSDAACRTYIVLAESVNDALRRDNGEWLAWPSAETIARRSGVTRRSVFRAVDELEAARLLERRRGGGRKSTQYCLLSPKQWAAPVTPVTPVTSVSPVPAVSSQPRPPRHGSDDVAVTRQRKKDRASIDSSRARGALIEAGVGSPTLEQLLANHSEDELLLRIEDWHQRKTVGKDRSVAWLIASIRNRYDLHPKTVARREATEKKAVREAIEARRRAEEQAEEERQRQIERRVGEMFDALGDDELQEWKERAIEEYTPGLSRGLERADPRVNERLKRRILGLLSRELAGEFDARGGAAAAGRPA
jgi:hypothetical protein